jgi:rubrerythrin
MKYNIESILFGGFFMVFCPYRKMNMPDMQSHIPLCNDIPQRLIKAMIGEQNARLFYLELANMTSDPEDKKLILGIARDEMKHFNNFGKLYMHLSGEKPSLPPPEKPVIRNFVEGVKKSIIDETDAYEFYRDTFLCNDRYLVKNIFLEAFTDENEHAIRFNYIFTKTRR